LISGWHQEIHFSPQNNILELALDVIFAAAIFSHDKSQGKLRVPRLL
jgi:hypothetical protein